MDHDNGSHRRGAQNFQNALPPSTYELGQMTEMPLGLHPGTIRIEKFYAKTVSILLFLMFEKCRFCENYPPSIENTWHATPDNLKQTFNAESPLQP